MKLSEAVKIAKSIRMEHARRFATEVAPEIARPARILWNQAIGGIFLLFALLFFGYAVKYFRALDSSAANPIALAFSAFLGLIMLFFGISSFRNANRVGRVRSKR